MPLIFEYGVDSPQFGSVLLSLAAAFLSLFLAGQPPSTRRTGARTIAIALLAVLSIVVDGPLLLTAALLVFAAGDAFLAQNDSIASRIGVSCFLAGQVSYAVLFFRAVEPALYLSQPWRAVPAIALSIAMVFSLRGVNRLAGSLRLPFLAYLVLALATGVLALGTVLPGVSAGAVLLAVFACLLLGDLLRQSADRRPTWMDSLRWATYYMAHLLITLSALALL
jgi:uncharacterized membrane protein YhhN